MHMIDTLRTRVTHTCMHAAYSIRVRTREKLGGATERRMLAAAAEEKSKKKFFFISKEV